MKTDNTKRIDHYLSGELSAEQHQAFELELNTNPALRNELELQSNLLEATKRATIRAEVKSTARKYFYTKLLKWSLGGLSVIALSAMLLFTFLPNNEATNSTLAVDEKTEINIPQLKEKELIPNLDREIFLWNGEDSLFFSKSGVLVSVPKGAFLKDSANYTGEVVIEWQEAVDGATIMMAGLSTMADSNLLETQGMFSFRATDKDGNLLEVNPEVGIYVQVPVDEIKTGMQLYDGEINEEGIINWVNPVPLEKIPVSVPMSELNFYPKGYEDTLNKLKLNTSKKYRDSLYLACEFMKYDDWTESATPKDIEITTAEYSNMNELNQWLDETTSSVSEMEEAWDSYIPPSKVLSFWKPEFDNTILATREFERRMQVLHGLCKEELLDLYIKNIDKPMHYVDSIIARKGNKQFELFAAERVGGVDLGNAHANNLKQFYEKGIAKLKEDLQKIREKEREKDQKWDAKVHDARILESITSRQRDTQLFNEEYSFNHRQTRKQLGLTQSFKLTSNVRIVNIDREVYEATKNRKTSIVRLNGKKAVIKYNDFSFNVKNFEEYNNLFVYLLPDKLNSYHRLLVKNGAIDYPLNDQISYDFVVLGMNEDGYFYHEVKGIKEGALGQIALKPITVENFEEKIKTLNNNRLDKPLPIENEFSWLKLEQENYKVQRIRQDKWRFLERMRMVVFPCYVVEGSSTNPDLGF